MKTLIILIFSLQAIFGINSTDCKSCDLTQLKFIQENIENLTSVNIENYFCSFDSKCKSNSEYLEWNNEILFEIIEKQPELFLKVLQDQNLEKQNMIFEEIENPVLEMNFDKLYDKIEKANSKNDLKGKVLNSIQKAENKIEK